MDGGNFTSVGKDVRKKKKGVSDVLSRKSASSTIDLWNQGIPVSVRGQVWLRAIGNKLQITPELFGIFSKQARGMRKKLLQRTAFESGPLEMGTIGR